MVFKASFFVVYSKGQCHTEVKGQLEGHVSRISGLNMTVSVGESPTMMMTPRLQQYLKSRWANNYHILTRIWG